VEPDWISPEDLAALDAHYGSEIEQANFYRDCDEADWVEYTLKYRRRSRTFRERQEEVGTAQVRHELRHEFRRVFPVIGSARELAEFYEKRDRFSPFDHDLSEFRRETGIKVRSRTPRDAARRAAKVDVIEMLGLTPATLAEAQLDLAREGDKS
jgi:hypothetical protein